MGSTMYLYSKFSTLLKNGSTSHLNFQQFWKMGSTSYLHFKCSATLKNGLYVVSSF